jgi:hypothetical protein
MFAIYASIFLLGCGAGALLTNLARRRRQRRLAREIMQAIDTGQLIPQSVPGRALQPDSWVDGRAYRRPQRP